jgi:site-specific DNA-methyltransferase (adenine-specific)
MVSVNKGAWTRRKPFKRFTPSISNGCASASGILKPDGTIWVSGTNHNIYSVGFALQTLEFKVLNDIAWYKVNPPAQPRLSLFYARHRNHSLGAARTQKQASL